MIKNTLFKDLRTDKYRSQIVRAKKGKGSFSRKDKHSRLDNDRRF
nr:MAG TPA: Ribosome, ArfA, RF2, nonstop translation [Caudoviricetes sp.]